MKSPMLSVQDKEYIKAIKETNDLSVIKKLSSSIIQKKKTLTQNTLSIQSSQRNSQVKTNKIPTSKEYKIKSTIEEKDITSHRVFFNPNVISNLSSQVRNKANKNSFNSYNKIKKASIQVSVVEDKPVKFDKKIISELRKEQKKKEINENEREKESRSKERNKKINKNTVSDFGITNNVSFNNNGNNQINIKKPSNKSISFIDGNNINNNDNPIKISLRKLPSDHINDINYDTNNINSNINKNDNITEDSQLLKQLEHELRLNQQLNYQEEELNNLIGVNPIYFNINNNIKSQRTSKTYLTTNENIGSINKENHIVNLKKNYNSSRKQSCANNTQYSKNSTLKSFSGFLDPFSTSKIRNSNNTSAVNSNINKSTMFNTTSLHNLYNLSNNKKSNNHSKITNNLTNNSQIDFTNNNTINNIDTSHNINKTIIQSKIDSKMNSLTILESAYSNIKKLYNIVKQERHVLNKNSSVIKNKLQTLEVKNHLLDSRISFNDSVNKKQRTLSLNNSLYKAETRGKVEEEKRNFSMSKSLIHEVVAFSKEMIKESLNTERIAVKKKEDYIQIKKENIQLNKIKEKEAQESKNYISCLSNIIKEEKQNAVNKKLDFIIKKRKKMSKDLMSTIGEIISDKQRTLRLNSAMYNNYNEISRFYVNNNNKKSINSKNTGLSSNSADSNTNKNNLKDEKRLNKENNNEENKNSILQRKSKTSNSDVAFTLNNNSYYKTENFSQTNTNSNNNSFEKKNNELNRNYNCSLSNKTACFIISKQASKSLKLLNKNNIDQSESENNKIKERCFSNKELKKCIFSK